MKTTDPEFWAELTMDQSDESLPGMEETLPEDVEPSTELEDADADDSDLSMPTLIAALTRDIPETVGSRKTGTLTTPTRQIRAQRRAGVSISPYRLQNLRRFSA